MGVNNSRAARESFFLAARNVTDEQYEQWESDVYIHDQYHVDDLATRIPLPHAPFYGAICPCDLCTEKIDWCTLCEKRVPPKRR
jgi:hypothetical protein